MLLPAQCARSTLPSQHKNLTAWNSSTHCFVAEARPQIRVALLSENAQQCMNPTTAVQGKRLPLCVGQPLRHCAPSVQAPTASSAGRWPPILFVHLGELLSVESLAHYGIRIRKLSPVQRQRAVLQSTSLSNSCTVLHQVLPGRITSHSPSVAAPQVTASMFVNPAMEHMPWQLQGMAHAHIHTCTCLILLDVFV